MSCERDRRHLRASLWLLCALCAALVALDLWSKHEETAWQADRRARSEEIQRRAREDRERIERMIEELLRRP